MTKEKIIENARKFDPRGNHFAALLKYAGEAYPGLEITTINGKVHIVDNPGPFANLNQKIYPYNPNDGLSLKMIEDIIDSLANSRKKKKKKNEFKAWFYGTPEQCEAHHKKWNESLKEIFHNPEKEDI